MGDAHRLLSITDVSTFLHPMDKNVHYVMRAMVEMYRRASYVRAIRYLREAERFPPFLSHPMMPFALFRMGKYKKHIALYRHDRLPKIENYFYLEHYEEVARKCELQRKEDGYPPLKRLQYGLEIYCNIKLGKMQKAKRLLKQWISRDDFHYGPVVHFCIVQLNQLQWIRTKYDQKLCITPWWASSTNMLFHAMDAQIHKENYVAAIGCYHEANFSAVHP